MAGPMSVPKRQVPRRVIRGLRLPDTVDRTEKYVTDRAQFDQQYLADLQRGITDQNGQLDGGIVHARDLANRVHIYQFGVAAFPHVGDLPSQPSAVTYDGPLNFGALPNGVNSTYGYARWAGWLNIAVAGTYNFNLVSTGGSNLFVNKVQLIGNLTAASSSASANATLQKGMVPICVEWQWSTVAPSLSLKWTSPSSSQVLLPNTVLSRSVNQVSGFIVGYFWNGSVANWMP